jgi:hypothetical protein
VLKSAEKLLIIVLFAVVGACAPASAATEYVTPGGTGVACLQAAPCGSLNDAYQASSPGDTVEVAAGNYPGQTVQSKHAVGTATVTFEPAPGADVMLGDLTNYANEVHYQGMRAAPSGSSLGDGEVTARAGTNVLFEFLSGTKPYVWGASATSAPVNNTFRGGVWVRNVGCSGGDSVQVTGVRNDDNTIANPRNIVFDGIDLSGFKLPAGCAGTPHQDCIHTFFVDGFTLRNSRIHGCEHFGILVDSDQIDDNSAAGADNILIENNFFWDAGIADIRPRGDSCSGGCIEKFNGLIVRHNSTELDLIGAADFHNALWQDNVSENGVNCDADITYGGNISPAGDLCVGDTRAATGFISATDFHLAAGAPAIDAAVGAGHPVADIDGQTRDSQPDAGADEFGDGSTPPPSPPPSPSPAPSPDTNAPDTMITAGPADSSSTTDTSASFSFTADEPATFQCSLDTATPSACTSPAGYTGLAAGAHSFSVQATDTAGNTDQSPATRSWTVTATTPGMVVGRKTITPARSDWTASGELDAWKFASANVTITKLCGQTGQTGLSNSRVTSVGLAIYTSNSSGTRPASLIRTGRFIGAPSTTGVFCAAITPTTLPATGSVWIGWLPQGTRLNWQAATGSYKAISSYSTCPIAWPSSSYTGSTSSRIWAE